MKEKVIGKTPEEAAAELAEKTPVAAEAPSVQITVLDKHAVLLEARRLLNSAEGLSKLARMYMPNAFVRLMRVLENPDDRIAMPAIKELFDRGVGRAVSIAVRAEEGPDGESLEARVKRVLDQTEAKQVTELKSEDVTNVPVRPTGPAGPV